MKVSKNRPTLAGRARLASAIALASALIVVSGILPAPASAITRTTVLSRAHVWVAKRVSYSQSRTYGGYRRDCSGFVSMAWRLGTSHTSRTIHTVARRVAISHLRPGDAVRTPGHVAIFVRWKDKAKRTYVAMEESRPGMPALRRVRGIGRGATALRYLRITDAPRTIAAVAPSVDATPMVTATAALPLHILPQPGVLVSL